MDQMWQQPGNVKGQRRPRVIVSRPLALMVSLCRVGCHRHSASKLSLIVDDDGGGLHRTATRAEIAVAGTARGASGRDGASNHCERAPSEADVNGMYAHVARHLSKSARN